MKNILHSPFCMLKKINRSGFTLIELAIVMVIVGIIISVVATVIPSLIQTAKNKKTQAILEKMDYAIQGYVVANHRLPCPDSTGDGKADPDDGSDCSGYACDLPYITLGLSNGEDAWGNTLLYAVYGNTGSIVDLTNLFTDADDFCDNGLTAAADEISDGDDGVPRTGDDGYFSAKLYTTFTDADNNPDPSTNSGQAYILASDGAKDLMLLNGFFDDLNDTDLQFDAPNKLQSPTYDDIVTARSVNYLLCRNCSAAGEPPGPPGGHGIEICDDPLE